MQDKFKAGDLAMAFKKIVFSDGTEHVPFLLYGVTEANVSYFNVNHVDYEKVIRLENPVVYKVVLTEVGPQKLNLVKLVRTWLNCSLLEAKTIVEAESPSTVAEGLPEHAAISLANAMDKLGSTTEIIKIS